MHFFLPLKCKMYSTCPLNYSSSTSTSATVTESSLTPPSCPCHSNSVLLFLQNLTSFEVEIFLLCWGATNWRGLFTCKKLKKKTKNVLAVWARRTNMQRNENSSTKATKAQKQGKEAKSSGESFCIFGYKFLGAS